MEHFVVSALKYRPQSFEDVVGQKSITTTLKKAIENNHLAQALLFCGPRGVGKTTCARILAREINKSVLNKEDEDFAFSIFELDAASTNSVDDIRNLIDQVRIPPQVGKYKVYIIDEVHMLSTAAFNAFLKTLEEPPKHAIFILATTEKHKIIPTILSRCQIFDFKRITLGDIKEYLKRIAENQGIQAEEGALHIIAQKSEGAMRDALSIFDRVVSFSGTQLTRKAVTENLNVLDYEVYIQTTQYILENNTPELLLLFNQILAKGFEGIHFITGLASHFRDLMVCQYPKTLEVLEVEEGAKEHYRRQSAMCSAEFLLEALDLANECSLKYKESKNQRLLVELCLMKLANLSSGDEKKKSVVAQLASPPEVKKEVSDSLLDTSEPSSTEQIPQEAEVSSKKEIEIEDKAEVTPVTIPAEASTRLDIESIGRISSLSLAGLKLKKEMASKKDMESNAVLQEEKPFTQKELNSAWNKFANIVEGEGAKILSSILKADLPNLHDDFMIEVTYPNETMKLDLEQSRERLLLFLRSDLKNHRINLKINVDEKEHVKMAYTPEEKYERLREINPAIDLLRRELDLDL